MFKHTKKLLISVALTIGLSFSAQASLIELANIDEENNFSLLVGANSLTVGNPSIDFFPPGRFFGGVGDFSVFGDLFNSVQAFTVGSLDLYNQSSTSFATFFNISPFGFSLTPETTITGLSLNVLDVLFDPDTFSVSFTGTAVLTNSNTQFTNLVFNGFFENIERESNGLINRFALGQFDIGYLFDPVIEDPTDVNAPATMGLLSLGLVAMFRRKKCM